MLTTPSQWPTDDALGALFQALAPQRLLEAALGSGPADPAGVPEPWTQCRAIEALYDPGRDVRVAYVLSRTELSSERIWPEGDVCYARYPVRRPMSRRGAVLAIDGFEVEWYRFPNDRRLRGLRKFSGRERAAQVWQSWLEEHEPGLVLQPQSLRRSLLRYVPEQKWIIHLQSECRSGPDGPGAKRALAVRASSVEDCRAIWVRARALRRANRDAEAGFHIPRLMAFDDRLGLLASRWAWGDSLIELLRYGDTRQIMQRVAGGLHTFHSLHIEGLPTLDAADYLRTAQCCADDLKRAIPSLTPAVEAVLSALAASSPPSPVRPATVHNDFHFGQLRGNDQRLTLLDFERCGRGDPLVDVATFLVQLAVLPLRPEMNVTASEGRSWPRAFADAWELTTGAVVDLQVTQWYGSVALLVLARGMLRHLRPGWPELAERCIELALQKLTSNASEPAW